MVPVKADPSLRARLPARGSCADQGMASGSHVDPGAGSPALLLGQPRVLLGSWRSLSMPLPFFCSTDAIMIRQKSEFL